MAKAYTTLKHTEQRLVEFMWVAKVGKEKTREEQSRVRRRGQIPASPR